MASVYASLAKKGCVCMYTCTQFRYECVVSIFNRLSYMQSEQLELLSKLSSPRTSMSSRINIFLLIFSPTACLLQVLDVHKCICPVSKTGPACEHARCPFNNCFGMQLDMWLDLIKIFCDMFQKCCNDDPLPPSSFSTHAFCAIMSMHYRSKAWDMREGSLCLQPRLRGNRSVILANFSE